MKTKIFLLGVILFAVGIITYQPILMFISYLLLGGGVLIQAARSLIHGQFFDENFLMSIATLGAFAIHEYPEAVAVMLFYRIGEYFQDLAIDRSEKSITALLDIRAETATLLDGSIVDPKNVLIGDIIIVKPGEKIPLDGIVSEGESSLDTSALTGESKPRNVSPSDNVLSGFVNQTGLLKITVTKIYEDGAASRIIEMVQNAQNKKAPVENFITVFAKYYTPIVILLSSLVICLPPLLLKLDWSTWINRGLVFLVISCPCALVASIPLSFFSGIGLASSKGILVKGGNYLDALRRLDAVVFDKTGTLTHGVFEVTEISPAEGYSSEELLEIAAHAESFSNHPIARSILTAYGKSIDTSLISNYTEIPGKGVSATINGKKVLIGNNKLIEVTCDELGTKAHISVDGKYLGFINISDKIKSDSYDISAQLKRLGIKKTIMLTGDNLQTAQEVANELKLDEMYAELLPDQKALMLQGIPGRRAFVGDGINDAPVLALSDVGIALGKNSSDAAMESADIVIMSDSPVKLVEAINISKTTHSAVVQNIVLALGIKGIFMLLGTLGIANMWSAVFADVGVSILAILNASRITKKSAK